MRIRSMMAMALCLFGLEGWAQEEGLPVLCVTTNKTTVIYSHYSIQHVDRGSRDVLVQKIKGVDTLLELKAARPDFPETNLTLLTGDGIIHMFRVIYKAEPPRLSYPIDSNSQATFLHAPASSGELNEAGYEAIADSILAKPVWLRVKDKSFGVKARIAGIYIHEEVLFFRFQFKNDSEIPYDVSSISYYIRDKSQSKRTASQDLAQTPLFFLGDHSRLEGRSSLDFVAALPKFTIPDKKLLFVVVKERNGGRLLRLQIKNKRLMRARLI